MDAFAGALSFGGTDAIVPTERDDTVFNKVDSDSSKSGDSEVDDDIPYHNPQTGEHSLKREHSPINASSEQAIKKFRVPGGKAAVAKRIVADYDSDDGRIISLKQQGYTDNYVAKKLEQEGRIRYVSRTVGSRWLRLRKALEQAEDEKLDDELSDWHGGEDELLEKSVKDIEDKIEWEIERIRQKKWKEVANHFAEQLQKRKYTATACEQRHAAIRNGTALLPIECDPDQEGRKAMREVRIAAAKRHRASETAATQHVQNEKSRRAAARKILLAERDRKKISDTLKREEKKRDEASLREECQMAREHARVQRAAARAQAQLEREWKINKRRAEKALYQKLTGKRLRSSLPAASNRHSANPEDGRSDGGEGDEYIGYVGDDDNEDSDNARGGASLSGKAKDKKRTKGITDAELAEQTWEAWAT